MLLGHLHRQPAKNVERKAVLGVGVFKYTCIKLQVYLIGLVPIFGWKQHDGRRHVLFTAVLLSETTIQTWPGFSATTPLT